MTTYKYEAMDSEKRMQRGRIEATSIDDAKDQLHDMDLEIVSVLKADKQFTGDLRSVGWWVIPVGGAIGAIFPLINGQLRREMLDEGTLLYGMLGTGVLGAASAALLFINGKIKNPLAKTAFMIFGILFVVVAVCAALVFILD